MSKYFKIILLSIFIFVFTILFSSITFKYKNREIDKNQNNPSVQGTMDTSVTIGAVIPFKDINFKVYPEKRIPKTGNWDILMNILLRNQDNPSITLSRNLTTSTQGEGSVTPQSSEGFIQGNYSIYIKTVSHLSKRYNNISLTSTNSYVDLTPYGDLLAGDTKHPQDDFINSLDISVLIINLNSNDYICDLNQDSQVNSLDLSNQIFNISKAGDG